MKRIFLLLFLFVELKNYAQDCNCKASLHYVENFVETNSPSYQNDVIDLKREKEYQQFKNEMDEKASQINESDSFSCVSLISQYFHFFHDEHLQINYKNSFWNNLNFDDTLATRKFFQKYPFVNNYEVPTKIDDKSIIGYWQSADGRVRFLIIPNKTVTREYAGIAISSDSLFWSKNQVMFEFTRNGESNYNCTRWAESRQPRNYDAELKDSILVIARTHKFYKMKNPNDILPKQNLPYNSKFGFKELSSKTNYIRIPTFADSKNIIDSIIKANKNLITSKPNLIIDIRDNGGGSDDSYFPLIPFIYKNKETKFPYTMSFYATKQNIKGYEEAVRKSEDFKDDSIGFLNIFKEHEQNEGHFVKPHFDSLSVDTIYDFPKNIAIITNSGDASSAEGFVMTAKESPKVKTYGDNTWGCFNYGNITMTPVLCLPIVIGVPTSKVFFVHPEYKNLEDVGFKPDVNLMKYRPNDWINIVKKKMEKSE